MYLLFLRLSQQQSQVLLQSNIFCSSTEASVPLLLPWHSGLNLSATSLMKWMSHVWCINVLKILEMFICWTKMYQTLQKHLGYELFSIYISCNFMSVACIASVQHKGDHECQIEILHCLPLTWHLAHLILRGKVSHAAYVLCTSGSAVCFIECLYCHKVREQERKITKEYNYNALRLQLRQIRRCDGNPSPTIDLNVSSAFRLRQWGPQRMPGKKALACSEKLKKKFLAIRQNTME